MRKLKKTLALILSLAMILTLIPMTAFADAPVWMKVKYAEEYENCTVTILYENCKVGDYVGAQIVPDDNYEIVQVLAVPDAGSGKEEYELLLDSANMYYSPAPITAEYLYDVTIEVTTKKIDTVEKTVELKCNSQGSARLFFEGEFYEDSVVVPFEDADPTTKYVYVETYPNEGYATANININGVDHPYSVGSNIEVTKTGTDFEVNVAFEKAASLYKDIEGEVTGTTLEGGEDAAVITVEDGAVSGSSVHVTIEREQYYRIKSLVVKGKTSGFKQIEYSWKPGDEDPSKYPWCVYATKDKLHYDLEFVMPNDDVMITVEMEKDEIPMIDVDWNLQADAANYQYTVKTLKQGVETDISNLPVPERMADELTTLELTLVPKEGTQVKKVVYQNKTTGDVFEIVETRVLSYEFTMPKKQIDCDSIHIGVEFEPAKEYSADVVETANGAFTLTSGDDVEQEALTVLSGKKVIINTNANEGFRVSTPSVAVKSVVADGETPIEYEVVEDTENALLYFQMPAMDVVVDGYFVTNTSVDEIDIRKAETENGSIVLKQETALAGEKAAFGVKADKGYKLDQESVKAVWYKYDTDAKTCLPQEDGLTVEYEVKDGLYYVTVPDAEFDENDYVLVSAAFVNAAVDTYDIDVVLTTSGSVLGEEDGTYEIFILDEDTYEYEPTGDQAETGEKVRINIIPNAGFQVDQIWVAADNDINFKNLAKDNYSAVLYFEMPDNAVTVTALLYHTELKVKADYDDELGSVGIPAAGKTAYYDDMVQVSVKANEHALTDEITVSYFDGTETVEITDLTKTGVDDGFYFTMPCYDVDVDVDFRLHQGFVSFDGNGATSGSMDDQMFEYDIPTAINANEYARAGYTFQGWADTATGAVAYLDSDTLQWLVPADQATRTLYAVWAPNTDTKFTIDFYDQNPEDDGYVKVGTDAGEGTTDTMTDVIPATKAGFHAVVENHNIDGDGSAVVNVKYDRNLHNVTNTKGNGIAAVTEAKIYKFGQRATVSATASTGYVFTEWTNSVGARVEALNPYSFVMKDADVQLIAKARPVNYKVAFNANGGSGEMAAQNFVYDAAQALSENKFERAGYSFAGWATSASGTLVYSNKEVVKNLSFADNGVVNLYAVWSANYSGGGSTGGGGGAIVSAAPTVTYSKNWTKRGDDWFFVLKNGETAVNAWLNDNAVASNGNNVWYLLGADGKMVNAPLVQDTTGNFYSIETNHNGYYGCLRHVNGTYDGIYMEFNQEHNGAFGAITNQSAIDALKEKYGVYKFGRGNESIINSADQQ